MSGRESRTRRIICLIVLLAAGAPAACAGSAPPRSQPVDRPAPRLPPATVLAAVRAAAEIRTLPADLTPSLATTARDVGFDNEECEAAPAADAIEPCVFGDRASAFDVVLYGDSHAGMWLPALHHIAEQRHWRLQLLGKPACPAVDLDFSNGPERRPFEACARFHEHVVERVIALRPELVLVTSGSFDRKRGGGEPVTASDWRAGLTRTLSVLRRSASRVMVLGDLPVLDRSAPECLAAHPRDVAACATPRTVATARVRHDAEQAAARATGSTYLPVLAWLCGTVCPPVIGNVVVYRNRFHLTATYARMLTGVLDEAVTTAYPAASRGDAAG